MPILSRVTAESVDDELYRIRHSTAHLMASAVCEIWPDTKLAFGPPISDGFYYDFETDHRFTDQDLEKIEARMRKIAKLGQPFERKEISKADALAMFEEQGEHLKREHVETLEDGDITLYTHGEFVDLCHGPHVENTRELKHFKLTAVSGSYWRGDEKRERLQRIYGTAWKTKDQLHQHLHHIKEAKRRDHRVLGRDLEMFDFPELAGPGLPFFLPAGARILQDLKNWMWHLNTSGEYGHPDKTYEPLSTPHILKTSTWSTSGHIQNYRDNMFLVYSLDELDNDLLTLNDNEHKAGLGDYGLKPMNCPGHVMMYNVGSKSYRDLPVRFFEFGNVYRYERAGTLHGLLRVRSFTQDDAHIFCTPEQFPEEVIAAFDFCCFILDSLGFDYYVGLKTRGEKRIGTEEIWDMAEAGLRDVLEKRAPGQYFVQDGDATFYGPKIDFVIKDSLGRQWQGGTVQLDFNLPERFELEYTDADNQRKRPVMIHRAVFGSFERFFGLMIEEFGGVFPVWCSPMQVRVLPVSERHLDYADSVAAALRGQGFRVEVDRSNEKLGKKIRRGKTRKLPYLIVVGDNEVEAQTITVEGYFDGRLNQLTSVDALAEHLRDEIERKVVRKP